MERLLHTFGTLYRLYLCLFISFKFIKMFIENCSGSGETVENETGTAPALLERRLPCRDRQ